MSLACQFNDDDALDWTASPFCCPLGRKSFRQFFVTHYKQFSPHNEALLCNVGIWFSGGEVAFNKTVICLILWHQISALCNISLVLPFLVKFLEVIKPFCAVLPEIQKPERKV